MQPGLPLASGKNLPSAAAGTGALSDQQFVLPKHGNREMGEKGKRRNERKEKKDLRRHEMKCDPTLGKLF